MTDDVDDPFLTPGSPVLATGRLLWDQITSLETLEEMGRAINALDPSDLRAVIIARVVEDMGRPS